MFREINLIWEIPAQMNQIDRDQNQVTETQMGAIAEDVVAIQLILESNGRLSPFKPMADDGGIDLLVYDKSTGHATPIQIKSRTKTLRRNPKIMYFEVRPRHPDRRAMM